MREIIIGNRPVGDGHPPWVVAEIGINHQGDLQTAIRLISMANSAGAEAVKFQVRTPRLCVPKDQWDVPKETPWGETLPYIQYRERMEFDAQQFRRIDGFCQSEWIDWFVSVWDTVAVGFIEQFNPIAYKIPSAKLTDWTLLKRVMNTGRPMILSTGMSTLDEIETALGITRGYPILLMHCTSTYPCPDDEINLRVIEVLMDAFPDTPIGFSNHSPGILAPTLAMALGACAVEVHVTLDRASRGSDHAASLERPGLEHIVKYARLVPSMMGDGIKKVYLSEEDARKRLRGG